MSIRRTLTALALCAAMASTSVAAPPPDKGGGKGGGNDGGGEDPPAEPFVPAIAYFEESPKGKDLKLANRAGDQACVVLQSRSGEPKLMGFVYHAASKRLAYSRSGVGIQIATWGDDPCKVVSGPPIPQTNIHEFMDFSPLGGMLAWSEQDPDYTGFGSSHLVSIYDVVAGTSKKLNLQKWGDLRPDWGVDGEWAAPIVQFSPDFETSNEIIFVGAPLSGSKGAYNSLFTYNLNEETAPIKLFDGAEVRFDHFVTVTNIDGASPDRVAFGNTNSGEILQISLSDPDNVKRFTGSEPDYSCDNSELIHQFSAKGNKTGAYITAADLSSSQQWSGSGLRFFDWFCP